MAYYVELISLSPYNECGVFKLKYHKNIFKNKGDNTSSYLHMVLLSCSTVYYVNQLLFICINGVYNTLRSFVINWMAYDFGYDGLHDGERLFWFVVYCLKCLFSLPVYVFCFFWALIADNQKMIKNPDKVSLAFVSVYTLLQMVDIFSYYDNQTEIFNDFFDGSFRYEKQEYYSEYNSFFFGIIYVLLISVITDVFQIGVYLWTYRKKKLFFFGAWTEQRTR